MQQCPMKSMQIRPVYQSLLRSVKTILPNLRFHYQEYKIEEEENTWVNSMCTISRDINVTPVCGVLKCMISVIFNIKLKWITHDSQKQRNHVYSIYFERIQNHSVEKLKREQSFFQSLLR